MTIDRSTDFGHLPARRGWLGEGLASLPRARTQAPGPPPTGTVETSGGVTVFMIVAAGLAFGAIEARGLLAGAIAVGLTLSLLTFLVLALSDEGPDRPPKGSS